MLSPISRGWKVMISEVPVASGKGQKACVVQWFGCKLAGMNCHKGPPSLLSLIEANSRCSEEWKHGTSVTGKFCQPPALCIWGILQNRCDFRHSWRWLSSHRMGLSGWGRIWMGNLPLDMYNLGAVKIVWGICYNRSQCIFWMWSRAIYIFFLFFRWLLRSCMTLQKILEKPLVLHMGLAVLFFSMRRYKYFPDRFASDILNLIRTCWALSLPRCGQQVLPSVYF